MIYFLIFGILWAMAFGISNYIVAEKAYRRTHLYKKKRVPVWCPMTNQLVEKSVVVRKPTKR